MVSTFEAEGEFIGSGLSQAMGTSEEERIDCSCAALRLALGRLPMWIAAPGGVAFKINEVLDRKAQTIEGAGAGRGQVCSGPGQKAIKIFAGNAHAVAIAASMSSEVQTKPKHFLTFQIVASVQNAGELVAQQSSSMMQP